MSDPLASYTDVLARFDERADGFHENEVFTSLLTVWGGQKERGESITDELKAECLAFAFTEARHPTWDSYFGPRDTGKDAEWPSLKELTPPNIAYWIRRAQASKHPVLRIRYAGLGWEFAPKGKGAKRPIEMARTLIESVIALSKLNLGNGDTLQIQKLGWALLVAVSIGDDDRMALVRDAILIFEDRVAQDQYPGLWGFSFKFLLNNQRIESRKIGTTNEQKQKIIDDLEARLSRISNEDVKLLAPQKIDEAARGLASYYRRAGQPEEVKRILNLYANSYLRKASASSAMIAFAWLHDVHKVLVSFQLYDEAQTILARCQDYASKATDEMPILRTAINLDPEKVRDSLHAMTEGNWDTVFSRLISFYLPSWESSEKFVRERAGKSPFLASIPTIVMDQDGRATEFGTVDEDLDSNIILDIKKNIECQSQSLSRAIRELIHSRNLNSSVVLDFIYHSFAFDEGKRAILEAGLDAYFAEQWLIAIHLLIPQIEDAVRNIVKQHGESTIKPDSNSGSSIQKNLNELLREEIVKATLTSDGSQYLRALLADKRGKNIRNDVCHGLPPVEYFCADIADWLLHAVLFLGARSRQPS